MSNYRYDNRDIATFKKDIARSHDIQRWLIEYWVKEMAANAYQIEYTDKGTDNSGQYVKWASSAPDYEVTIFDKMEKTTTKCNLEVKTAPHYRYLNFKVESLKAIVQHNAHCLLFIGVETKAESRKVLESSLATASWCFFSPKTATKILDTLPARHVPQLYGGKACIEIKAKFFKDWFVIHAFGKPLR